jgi:outer membrane protein OmpA-like peptidoglycan-associated protein
LQVPLFSQGGIYIRFAILLAIVVGSSQKVTGQNYMYDWGVRADMGVAQYSGDLANQIGAFSLKAPSLAFSYGMYLNPFIDLQLGFGMFGLSHVTNFPGFPLPGDISEFKAGFLAINTLARIKLNNGILFSEENLLSPYIVTGLSMNYTAGGYIGSKFIGSIPLGAGLTYHWTEHFSFNMEWKYNRTFFDRLDDYPDSRGGRANGKSYDVFALPTVGVQYNFGPVAGELSDVDEDGIPDVDDQCPTRPGSEVTNGCPDSDGDGILDDTDACPNQGGPPTTKGCPDKDGDGLPDWQDRCPDRSGPLNTGGCPDTDGDGLTDDIDACAEKKGPRSTSGCPDSDGDGIPDNQDKCPNSRGSRDMNGCADTDNDGVSDETDKCPSVKGSVNMGGCPDSDEDGVPDNLDRCPDEPGLPADNGCPPSKKQEAAPPAASVEEKKLQQQLNVIVKNLQFEVGSSVIARNSFDDLDKLADLLTQNPNARLNIDGHTDNQGELEKNMRISRERAEAVMMYLVEKGIDEGRLKATGYGPTKPLVPNTSRENRAVNRRVELNLQQN